MQKRKARLELPIPRNAATQYNRAMRRPSRRQRFEDLPPEERAIFAETLRERIYSTITLLAVIVVLWQHPSDHRALGVIGIIYGTVGALWLATIIASRMSYRIVHDDHELGPRSHEAIQAASGLLVPATAPALFVLASLTGLISLATALFFGMVSLILSLFFFSVFAGRKLSDRPGKILLYSLLQLGLGIGVVALKLLVE